MRNDDRWTPLPFEMDLQEAVGYIRVSTEDQVEEGISLEAQRDRLAAWGRAHGYQMRFGTDRGISGARIANRDALQWAIKQACENRCPLVVYSLSRLARNTRETIEIAERLDQAGADLVSLTERIDTTTAAGKMIFRMLAVLAEFERDQTSERTRMALRHKRLQGKRTGAIPYGYDLDDDGEMLIQNQVQQYAISQILDLRGRGLSYRKIAEVLTLDHIPTKKGNETWTFQAVRSILKRVERDQHENTSCAAGPSYRQGGHRESSGQPTHTA